MEPVRRRPMLFTSRFWSGFRAGLTTPVGLFDRPPRYPTYLRSYSVAHSFSQVRRTLSLAAGQIPRSEHIAKSPPPPSAKPVQADYA